MDTNTTTDRAEGALWGPFVADANAGGVNVRRGMVLGFLAGAADPGTMRERATGLRDYDELKGEIVSFASLAGKASSY